ncbi:hypothetical protein QR680_002023 [Steinernema hermaphroditum]|uniref:Uncharacterized protein n=1 Tax=Steinernema hermaphroditum TaxID=289476 RepID=A0AA39LH96_9BILA|nr:hypothetical protein QR680_002023 [Steinernema hermaphroditum]
MIGKSPYSQKPTRGCGTSLVNTLCAKYRGNEQWTDSWCFKVNESNFEGRLCCCTIYTDLWQNSSWLAAGPSKVLRMNFILYIFEFGFLITVGMSSFVRPLREVTNLSDAPENEDEKEVPTIPSLLEPDANYPSKQRIINDKATLRTLSIVHYKGTESRLVLLLCRNQCVRHRSLIPRWIREFVNENNSTRDDPIFFHFHYLKRGKLPVYSLEAKQPSVFYFVGGTYFKFDGDLSNKDHFMNWLQTRENANSQHVVDWSEVENILKENTGCNDNNQLIMISSDEHCPYDYWPNLARSLNEYSNLSLYEIRRPFNVEIEIVLYQRFPKLSGDCLQMVLVSDNAYAELPILDNVAEMRENILSQIDRGCTPPRYPWMAVDIPLTEIQLEYYSRDNLLRTNEMKPHFILVGGIAGVSVVALAISIFWGLNGTAFKAQK